MATEAESSQLSRLGSRRRQHKHRREWRMAGGREQHGEQARPQGRRLLQHHNQVIFLD